MKKFFFAALLAALSIGGAKAQTPLKYHGEVDLGYSIGVGTFATDRINLHTIQGVRIGKYFSTGLGIGLDYYRSEDEFMLPIYLNLKGYLPLSPKVSPYFSLDIGGGVGVTEYTSGLSGLYCTPAVGIKVRKLKVQLGYNVQRISQSGIGADMNAIQIKVGIVF